MKPEKFILKRVKPKTRAKGWKPVTIKLDVYEQLMEISDTTGESICSIASSAIEFALENLVIED